MELVKALRWCLMTSRELTSLCTRFRLLGLILECYFTAEQLVLVALLQVDEIYTVPEVGTVVGGTLSR